MLKRFLKIRAVIILLMAIPGLYILSGCFCYSPILFIYKNYSYEILESNSRMKKTIKKNCTDNGYVPQFAVITKKGEESILEIINESKASLIYLDSLIRESPGTISEKYPDRLFFTLKRNMGRTAPMNLLTLHFDHKETFKQAGIITGKLLLEELPEKEAIKKESVNNKKKAGMIIYPASLEVQQESAEYMNGFNTVQTEYQVIYREVNSLEDKVNVKNILDEMISEGVAVVFLRLYYLDTYALDYLEKQGVYAIVENLDPVSGYKGTILFSIKDNFPMSLLELFKNIRKRKDGTSEWKKKEIKGKVNILWGSVIKSPEK